MIIKLFSAAQYEAMRDTRFHSSWASELEQLWKSWNLRIFVLFSFFLQCFLLIGAAFRKQRTSRALIGLIWLAYVLADWAAYYALGLISNSTSYCSTTSHGNLHGFWAPFLLLHLGGPSTITAFSLDDTSMWVRGALNLTVQGLAAAVAFVDLLPDNQLWIASILVFFAAIIKYFDRVLSLYVAASTKSTVKLPRKVETLDTTLEVVEEDEPFSWGELSEDVQIGKDAYGFFETYKGLYGDLFYTYTDDEWTESKAYFSRLDAAKTFSLMELELSLAYEVFYTKIGLIQRPIERMLYPFSILCVIAALVLWIVTDKDEYNNIDIGITYALLIGAVLVDVFSALVVLFSDWMIAYLITSNQVRHFTHLTRALIAFRKRRWVSWSRKRGMKQPYFWTAMISRVFFPHWSEAILQLNLVSYCLNDRTTMTQTLLMKYYQIIGDPTNANLSEVEFTAELRDFIFREIQERGESKLALGKVEKLCSGKARWTLKKYYASLSNNVNAWNPFAEAFHGLDQYDEKILVLHLATELCFHSNAAHVVGSSSNEAKQQSKDRDWRKFSKVLSDYMFYLLVLQQDIVFVPRCLWESMFPEVCAEFKRIAKQILPNPNAKADKSTLFDQGACEKFMEIGCKSENKVLHQACMLAMNIIHYEERRWEILSKVWMEMLCHAAIHSRGSAHGGQLSLGGELLTFIWLILAHFKLGKQLMYKDDDDDDDDDHDVIKMRVPESPSTGGEDNWQFESA